MPNQCSSSNTFVYYTCMVLLHLHCPSGALLRYAVWHAACNSSSFLTAAPVSFANTSFIRSSLHFISPRSQLAVCFKAGSRHQSIKANTQAGHQPLRKPPLQYSLGSIPLRSSLLHFSYCSVHPLPIIWLAGRPTSAAFTLRLLYAHVVPPFRKASLRFTCIVQPPSYPNGKYTTAASYGAGILAAP